MDAKSVRRAVSRPHLIFHRLLWDLNRNVMGRTGVRLMDEDWDNLIILDACRYDLFADRNTIDGTLSKVVSAGSHTVEFLHVNFADRHFADTVYFSATPQLYKEGLEDRFFETVRLWSEHWDEQLGTVPPEEVAARVIDDFDDYRDKRLIVHFVQPHFPFIGERGRQLAVRSDIRSGLERERETTASIWELLERGAVSKEDVRAAYRENFDVVLPHVSTLVDRLPGLTVVTSDHGNVFGRLGLYGHPSKKFLSELVEVPWLVAEGNERRRISQGEIADSGLKTEPDVTEQLRDLGYTA